MKHILLFLLLAAVAGLFAFCKSNKPKHSADMLPPKQLRWGSGGGFTGKETVNTLLENGQIFQFSSMTNQITELGGTKAKTAKGHFAKATTSGLDLLNFNNPGNMYYFIETKDGEATNRVTWGDEKTPLMQEVKDFYTALQQLLATK